jgi:hypothetical protein
VTRYNEREYRRTRTAGVLLVALTAFAAVPRAAAAEATTAEQLDADGTAALDAGDFAAACPKLAESHRLEPGIGVLMRLALCYERAGLTASAWKRYREAAELAHRTGNTQVGELARRRMVALEPLLSEVTLRVHRVAGLRITLDGAPVASTDWDRPLPIDAGVHEVVATAPGMQRFAESLSSPDLDRDATVDVELASKRDHAEVTHDAPKRPPPPELGWQRTAALTLGAVSVAGLVLGGISGGLALSSMDSARDQCPTYTHCPPSALALQDRARDQATIADIAFAAGGTAAIAGLVLWFLAPTAATQAGLQVTPVVFARGGGLASSATF